jgi:hypothetical protein
VAKFITYKTPQREILTIRTTLYLFLIFFLFTGLGLEKIKAESAVGLGTEDILTSTANILKAKKLPADSEAVLFLERYRFYQKMIDEGSYYLGFKENKIPYPYNMAVFQRIVEPGFLDSFKANALAGKDPFEGMTGFLERAYQSVVDGSIDSYLIYIPKSYNPAKSAPLLVELHGNGAGAYINPMQPAYSALLTACERSNVILVAPNGRNQMPIRATAYERRWRNRRSSGHFPG